MSASSTLAKGRRFEERLMVDACRITRPGEGRGPWNDSIDDYDPPARVTVYEGRCQVQGVNAQTQSAEAGQAGLDLRRVIVKVPVAASPGVAEGDDVEITSATHDPDLLGRHFTVQAPDHQTFAAARRLPCVEVV